MHGTLTERVGDIGDRLRERRTTGRIEHLDDENDRLRMELSSLRTLLDREREERDQILDALKGKPKTVVKKKRGGLVRLLVIGGGAYVLGARAGRARYEQLRTWANRMRDRARGTAEDFRDDVNDAMATAAHDEPTSPTTGFGSTGGGTTGPGTTGPTTTTTPTTTSKSPRTKPASSASDS